MRLAAAALGLLLAACGGAASPDRALYVSGGQTFRFSEAASARLRDLVARAPAPQKMERLSAEPPGLVRVGGDVFEFHGNLIRWIDADRALVIRDPMLEVMWGSDMGPGHDGPVRRADAWIQSHR